MRMPTLKARPKVMVPPATFSRYERMPKKTSRKARIMEVYPRTSLSCMSRVPFRQRGMRTAISPAMMPPEMSPKVSTTFFI
jgi:hypothetical protein